MTSQLLFFDTCLRTVRMFLLLLLLSSLPVCLDVEVGEEDDEDESVEEDPVAEDHRIGTILHEKQL